MGLKRWIATHLPPKSVKTKEYRIVKDRVETSKPFLVQYRMWHWLVGWSDWITVSWWDADSAWGDPQFCTVEEAEAYIRDEKIRWDFVARYEVVKVIS